MSNFSNALFGLKDKIGEKTKEFGQDYIKSPEGQLFPQAVFREPDPTKRNQAYQDIFSDAAMGAVNAPGNIKAVSQPINMQKLKSQVTAKLKTIKLKSKNVLQDTPTQASKGVTVKSPLYDTPKTGFQGEYYRFESPKSKTGEVRFFSKNKDYAEEYQRVRGERGIQGEIVKEKINLKNPLTVNAKSNEFSDPTFEKKYLDLAKSKGNDGVIFKSPEGDEFVAVIKPNVVKGGIGDVKKR